MSDDRFNLWLMRAVRVAALLLGIAGCLFEALSPHRTLWVGLLAVGLLMGQAAGISELLGGDPIRIHFGREKEKPDPPKAGL
jgi:hypothetical protein